jgi:AraC-like DNA-binding protein
MYLIPPSFFAALRAYLHETHPSVTVEAIPDSALSMEEADTWLSTQAVRTSDPDIGLHFGCSPRAVEAYGLLGLIARSATTFGSGLTLAHKFSRLFGAGEFPFHRTDAGIFLPEPVVRHSLELRHLYEAQFASTVYGLRVVTGAAIDAIAIAFPHAKPESIESHRRVFPGTMLSFGAAEPGILLPHSSWDLPMRHADEVVLRFLHALAEQELAKLPAPSADFIARVRQLLSQEMASARPTPTLRRVARLLAVSERTLQRRLQHEHLAFRQMVDDTRREFALRLLRKERDLSLDSLCARIGLADTRSLRRAVKRWTGQSVSALRLAKNQTRQ